MRCPEHCTGGPWGGHHKTCPASRECAVCGGPIEPEENICKDCEANRDEVDDAAMRINR